MKLEGGQLLDGLGKEFLQQLAGLYRRIDVEKPLRTNMITTWQLFTNAYTTCKKVLRTAAIDTKYLGSMSEQGLSGNHHHKGMFELMWTALAPTEGKQHAVELSETTWATGYMDFNRS